METKLCEVDMECLSLLCLLVPLDVVVTLYCSAPPTEASLMVGDELSALSNFRWRCVRECAWGVGPQSDL